MVPVLPLQLGGHRGCRTRTQVRSCGVGQDCGYYAAVVELSAITMGTWGISCVPKGSGASCVGRSPLGAWVPQLPALSVQEESRSAC